MNPRIVRWSFQNIHMPMIDIGGSELVCTNKQLMLGLGCSKRSLLDCYNTHKNEMTALRYVNPYLKDFLIKNKTELGLERVREDIVLWSEDAMMCFAFFIKTPNAVEFRKELRAYIKDHRTIYTGGLEQLQRDMRQELNELHEFKDMVKQAIPNLEEAAKLAGSMLQAQKGTKHLRLVS